MKSEKQRIKSILKKRITRFLKSNPDWKINPNKFKTLKEFNFVPYTLKETCILGVVLFKTDKDFISCTDVKIREISSNVLGIEYNQVRQLENGFMDWEMWIAEPDTEFTEIGKELRSWLIDKFPDRFIQV